MILIAVKHKLEEHLLMATYAKYVLISMAKVFSFSTLLLQQSCKSPTTVSSLYKSQQNMYLVISSLTDMLLILF